MEDMDLNDDELFLVMATKRGDEASFAHKMKSDGMPGALIRVERLRRLILGLPLLVDPEGEPEIVVVPGPGVRLVCAHVFGDLLNLDYGCMPNGDELPRLSMERCYIPGTIGLRSARLRRLCLLGSKISLVIAHNAYISGQLDIREVESAGTMDGCQQRKLCRFGLRGAHIEDGIDARRAKLVMAPARPGYTKYSTRARYALDLAEARVEGDIRLFPDFECYGGVNLNGATVKGSIQAHGATITAEEMYAFDVSNAHIEGRVALDSRPAEEEGDCVRFHGIGEFRFFNANLTASLRMNGADIKGSIHGNLLKTQGEVSFCAYHGVEIGHARILPFICTGPIELRGARIGGNLDCKGANFAGMFDASNSHIEVDVVMGVFEYEGRRMHAHLTAKEAVVLDEVRISGDLDMQGAQLKKGISAKGMHVAGYCRMGYNKNFREIFKSDASVQLHDAQVGLDLDMSGAFVDGEIIAPNLHVGGKLLMCGPNDTRNDIRGTIKFHATGRIDLSGAIIQNNFDLRDAFLQRGLRFRGAQVRSAFLIKISGGEPYDIGTDKKPKLVPTTIDLINSHANVISDFNNDGDLRYGSQFRLRLEGFTYGRFKSEDDIESLLKEDAEGQKLYNNIKDHDETITNLIGGAKKNKFLSFLSRKKSNARHWQSWLNMQYLRYTGGKYEVKLDRENYAPSPFDTLSHVLKQNGLLEAADDVLVQKLRSERRINGGLRNPFQWPLYPFDLCFRWGLSPISASITYCLYIAAVTVFISCANDGIQINSTAMNHFWPASPKHESTVVGGVGILVLKPQPVSSQLRLNNPASSIPEDYLPLSDASGVTDVPCGRHIQAPLYALDMIVPGLDLNQKAVCEISPRSFWWNLAKALLTMIGWVLTSLTVLTWTGIIRRRIEP